MLPQDMFCIGQRGLENGPASHLVPQQGIKLAHSPRLLGGLLRRLRLGAGVARGTTSSRHWGIIRRRRLLSCSVLAAARLLPAAAFCCLGACPLRLRAQGRQGGQRRGRRRSPRRCWRPEHLRHRCQRGQRLGACRRRLGGDGRRSSCSGGGGAGTRIATLLGWHKAARRCALQIAA